MSLDTLIIAASLGLVATVTYAYSARVRRKQKADEQLLAQAEQRKLHLPPSLHPVIDTDVCIGSFSCLEACPEGDVLGIVEGHASLIAGASCIGHGKCALECPVSAIRLVFGSSRRGVDLPDVDEHFESSRAGVHVVGELGGMGLIKNAINQGLNVAQTLAGRLEKRKQEPSVVDVAIVGAGPAGLAAALGCHERGLSYRVLEQDTVGGTIAHYPRQKVVMSEKVSLPGFGSFGKRLISKEELLSAFQKVIGRARLTIDEGIKVTGIEGVDGDFTVITSKLPVRARKVVLATGRRGSPRKLGVPGEELPKVSYRLSESEQYRGTRVLVVGGGDSAVEAAIQIAKETDAQVALSYRGEALARCREANRGQFEELVQEGRITSYMASEVEQISEAKVLLQQGGKRQELKNDFVIVSIGGELPMEFLKAVDVGLRRYRGEALGEVPPTDPAQQPLGARRKIRHEDAEEKKSRRLALSLFVVGGLIVAGLSVVGGEYYFLPRDERLASPLHEVLKPAGAWGHGVGIVATAFMLSNFLYALRKRWRRLKGYSTIRRWLTFHMFVGFMSPMAILFHAAFQSNNLLASGTFASVIVVVLTGIFGRFLYGLVPTQDGRAMEYADLVGRWERLKGTLSPLLEGVRERAAVEAVLGEATAPPPKGSLLGLALSSPGNALRNRLALRRIRKFFPSREHYGEFRAAFGHLARLRTQVGFYRSLKQLLSVWRILHVVLAVFLVMAIAAHIAVSVYLGYVWFFA